MNSTEFWTGVGQFFTDSFAILRAGGNTVNWLFIIVIAAGLAGWLFMQKKFNSKEMKESGELK